MFEHNGKIVRAIRDGKVVQGARNTSKVMDTVYDEKHPAILQIITQYPALGPIITQYPALVPILIDKPQLVAFLNEDNDLVHSLVETSKTRWLVTSGANNIDMGIQTSNATILKGTFRFTQSVGNVHIGYHPGNDSQDWRLFNLRGTLYWDCGSGRISQACALNSVAEIEVGDGYIILNGTQKTATTGSTIAKGNIGFAVNAAVDCRDKIEIYDGTDWHTFVPFISKDGVVGFVDTFACTVHFPKSGIATITLTDKH